MNKKIFRLSFFTSLIVLIVSFTLVFGVLYEYLERQIFDELESEASYISYAIENEGLSYLEKFNGSNKRITIVSSNGDVLKDTSVDVSGLDNHGNREEIRQALENGKGKSARYSDSLMQKTLYYAVKMADGNILRVSTTQNSVFVILMGLMQPLSVIVLVALILSLYLSHRVSQAILKPINQLDLENPSDNETYEELTPLLKKLSRQKKTIDKQIKDALQKQEEFKLITENMKEGLLVIDSFSNILTYNSAALRLLEIDEITQESVFTLNRTKNFREAVEKALGGERAEKELTSGERFYNLIASPVPEGDKIIGAVIVILDVTESKKQEQLRREFTSNVSHELKTPLTSISGFAEIMKNGGTPEETVVEFSTLIYEEAQRLGNLVSDIIKISELDENAVQFEKENVDIKELSAEIINRLKPQADKKNVKFSLIGEPAWVYGSRKILREMIFNLCDNAIKYNKEGGAVEVSINQSEKIVSLTVRDTGIGIPAADRDRVFERFYRVDKSHSRRVGGTGLGLSIVKHGAIFHNAEISLESVVDDFTAVTVTFKK